MNNNESLNSLEILPLIQLRSIISKKDLGLSFATQGQEYNPVVIDKDSYQSKIKYRKQSKNMYQSDVSILEQNTEDPKELSNSDASRSNL